MTSRFTVSDADKQAQLEELQAECERLRTENAALKKEIAYFRLYYGAELSAPVRATALPDAVASDVGTEANAIEPSDCLDAVTNQSSPEEKIALFMSLFRGREDVYAKRWHSEKSGKSGYQPVCLNEWNPRLCDKRKTKCADCKNRKFAPLSENSVRSHLQGKAIACTDTIGIYPLTEDGRCYFLAMDFDGEGWKEDISAVSEVCAKYDIPVLTERSRSGQGGHLWFFFADKIRASTARQLGTRLLGAAMRLRHDIGFSAYDRLFPNQDIMPKGGFGNLIALPLQGVPRRNGNSVFVDENFTAYPDQWRVLSSIPRIEDERLKGILGALSEYDEPNEQPLPQNIENNVDKKQKSGLTADDFPAIVRIVCSNMVFVEKAGVSERALGAIKRMGAYANPEFFIAQKMRLPTYGKPRFICVFEEDDTYLGIPRGRLSRLRGLLKEAGARFSLDDERNEGAHIDISFNGILREEQQRAFSALTSRDTGVLSATTAFGKTVVGARLIAEKKRNTLVLVHTSALLNQWKAALLKFLSFGYELPEQPKSRGRKKEISFIGQLGATKNTVNGKIDIAIIQSLGGKNGVKEFVKNYGLVIVDECHHVPALMFEQVLKAVRAKYVYGLTATPVRADGRQESIFMQCGDISYRIDAREHAEQQLFEHYTVPRFTDFRMPLAVDGGLKTLNRVFAELILSKNRNKLIVDDVVKAVDGGRMPIVLTERSEHANLLASAIEKRNVKVFLLVGKESAKRKREKLSEIAAAKPSERFAIVAIGRYVGEGFDFARLDTLFLAMPISWKGKLAQYAGRLHRDYVGKNEVIVYDYVDLNVAMLENMYHKRLSGYKEIGYEIRADVKSQKHGILYDKTDFKRVFDEDVFSVRKNIVIVSPRLAAGRITKFLRVFNALVRPKATVVTRGANGDPETQILIERLIKAGVSVVTRDDLHLRCAVIDGSLVWYGCVNPLGYAGETDSALRFDSPEIAETLIKQIEG